MVRNYSIIKRHHNNKKADIQEMNEAFGFKWINRKVFGKRSFHQLLAAVLIRELPEFSGIQDNFKREIFSTFIVTQVSLKKNLGKRLGN